MSTDDEKVVAAMHAAIRRFASSQDAATGFSYRIDVLRADGTAEPFIFTTETPDEYTRRQRKG